VCVDIYLYACILRWWILMMRSLSYLYMLRERERVCVCVCGDTYMHTPIYVERETERVCVCVDIYMHACCVGCDK